jgi:hypothetical protein
MTTEEHIKKLSMFINLCNIKPTYDLWVTIDNEKYSLKNGIQVLLSELADAEQRLKNRKMRRRLKNEQ